MLSIIRWTAISTCDLWTAPDIIRVIYPSMLFQGSTVHQGALPTGAVTLTRHGNEAVMAGGGQLVNLNGKSHSKQRISKALRKLSSRHLLFPRRSTMRRGVGALQGDEADRCSNGAHNDSRFPLQIKALTISVEGNDGLCEAATHKIPSECQQDYLPYDRIATHLKNLEANFPLEFP